MQYKDLDTTLPSLALTDPVAAAAWAAIAVLADLEAIVRRNGATFCPPPWEATAQLAATRLWRDIDRLRIFADNPEAMDALCRANDNRIVTCCGESALNHVVIVQRLAVSCLLDPKRFPLTLKAFQHLCDAHAAEIRRARAAYAVIDDKGLFPANMQPGLDANDLTVLRALADTHPALLLLEDLAATADISRKIAGEIVNRLLLEELVDKPRGPRKGATITPKGLILLKSLTTR